MERRQVTHPAARAAVRLACNGQSAPRVRTRIGAIASLPWNRRPCTATVSRTSLFRPQASDPRVAKAVEVSLPSLSTGGGQAALSEMWPGRKDRDEYKEDSGCEGREWKAVRPAHPNRYHRKVFARRNGYSIVLRTSASQKGCWTITGSEWVNDRFASILWSELPCTGRGRKQRI